jgi:hypothetical protein
VHGHFARLSRFVAHGASDSAQKHLFVIMLLVAYQKSITAISLFVWLVADGWCWFVLRGKYYWLIAGGWFVLREKYCWLVADKPNERCASKR